MGGEKTNAGQGVLKKSLITGAAVIMEMASGGLFMENVKMEKQRTSDPYPQIARRILGQGVKGFEAGLWPWGVVLGLTKGTVIGGARAFFMDLFGNQLQWKSNTTDLASGFCAGAVQGIAMSPILLARTRVNQSLSDRASAGKLSGGIMEEIRLSNRVLNSAISENGIGVLLTGMPQMIVKRSLDWGSRFIFFGMYRNHFQKRKGNDEPLTDIENLVSSFLGGATSCLVTMPIDRLMPIIQASGASKDSVISILRKKIAVEGITTLQRGGIMRCLHTGYHTTFAIFVANKIYDLLG